MISRTSAFVALALFATLAAAPRAAARAPSASDEGCLDWITQKLKDDRQEDLNPRIPLEDAKIVAYQKGETPLDDWRSVTDIIFDAKKQQPQARRERATSALIDRMRLEEQRGTDFKVIRGVKNDICNILLKLVLAEDMNSRTFIHRLTEAFLPGRVEWRPDDSKQKRGEAYQALYKLLNKK